MIQKFEKVHLSISTAPMCKGGCYSFPGIAHFTLDVYLIMLNVKQVSIKYNFLNLWYDSTWDTTPVSQTSDKHSTH